MKDCLVLYCIVRYPVVKEGGMTTGMTSVTLEGLTTNSLTTGLGVPGCRANNKQRNKMAIGIRISEMVYVYPKRSIISLVIFFKSHSERTADKANVKKK